LDQSAAASAGADPEIQKAKMSTLYLLSGAIPGTPKAEPIELPQYDERPSI